MAVIDAIFEHHPTPSLSDLGGVAAIARDLADTALSSHLVLILDAVTAALEEGTGGSERMVLESFVVECARSTHENALITREVIPRLAAAGCLSRETQEACFRALIRRIHDSSQEPIARWSAMDGALRFALVPNSGARRNRLLAELEDISPDDNEWFLRHAAKILGVAYSHWRDDFLIDRLTDLLAVAEAEDEAMFELGMCCVARALDAAERVDVEAHFSEARTWFSRSVGSRDDRTDAAIYIVVLDVLTEFARGAASAAVTAAASELSRLTMLHRAFHMDQEDPPWLGARWGELCQWQALAVQLGDASAGLDQDNPVAAVRMASLVWDRILSAYAASRTILGRDRNGGLETLVRPRILGTLIEQQGLLRTLDDWLAAEVSTEPWAETAGELRSGVRTRMLENALGNGAGTSGTNLLIGVLGRQEASRVGPAQTDAALRMATDYLRVLRSQLSPPVEDICERLASGLSGFADYRKPKVQEFFNTLIWLTVAFLDSRMNTMVGQDRAMSYLFDEPKPPSSRPARGGAAGGKTPGKPKVEADHFERAIQNDYASFLRAVMPTTKVEVNNISGGRADVTVTANGIVIVVEVKREDKDCSHEALRAAYAGQATEYTNTNVRLGILLVLDMSRTDGTAGHLLGKFSVKSVTKVGEDEPVGMVIAVLPGRRKRPSAIRI